MICLKLLAQLSDLLRTNVVSEKRTCNTFNFSEEQKFQNVFSFNIYDTDSSAFSYSSISPQKAPTRGKNKGLFKVQLFEGKNVMLEGNTIH